MLPGAPTRPSPTVTPCRDHPTAPAVITPVLCRQMDSVARPAPGPATSTFRTAPQPARQAASRCWMCEEAPEETLDTQSHWNFRETTKAF